MSRERTSGAIRPESRPYAGAMDQQDERYLAAKARVEAKKGFFLHLVMFVVLNVSFLIVVGREFLWATVFWGLGLGAHAASVYLRDSKFVRQWEQRAIQREMTRHTTLEADATTGAPEPTPEPPAAVDTTAPVADAPASSADETTPSADETAPLDDVDDTQPAATKRNRT